MFITVLWHDKDAEGYTDLLPTVWFLEVGPDPNCEHEVRGPHSGRYKARCDVLVSGSRADLDYEPHALFNQKQGMDLGVMRLQFTSTARVDVAQVLWKGKGATTFEPSSTTIGVEHRNERDQLTDVDLLGKEGGLKLVTHLRRERNQKLIDKKKSAVLADHGVLACEVCCFTFADKYGLLGKDYCEVHHLKALGAGTTKQTSLSDLAILCSNCHRMIHRTQPMMSLVQFRNTLLPGSVK